MAPLPVLHVLDSHHVGGAEYAWLDLIDLLQASDRAREHRFVCPPDPEYDGVAERAERAGLRCAGRLQIERTLDLRGRRAFAEVVRPSGGAAAIVQFNLNKTDSCRHQIAVARRLGGTSLIATLHGFASFRSAPSWKRFRCARALRSLDRIVAVSTPLRDHATALAPDVPASVIPNFVPDARMARASALRATREAMRRELALESDQVAAVSIATSVGGKGQDSLVEQLPRALARLPHFVLVLVGRDHAGTAARLRSRARALGCEAALRFAGWRDDVLEVLVACDALVHAPKSEGLGRVIQEAMAVELPVVSYAVGGVVDLVADGRTGLLVEPDRAERLIDRLVDLLADRSTAAVAGRAGAERLRAEFSAATVLAAWSALYAGLDTEPNAR